MRVARYMIVGLVAAALLAGCSSYRVKRKAQLSEQTGDWDQAVLHYLELVRSEPANLEYRAALLRAKIQASHLHFEKAKKYQEAGALERALLELQEAVQLDPTNQYAQVELEKVRELLLAQREERDIATSLETLKSQTEGALPQPPTLDPRSDEPIDLDFPEPVSVMDIYRALGKAFGINVLFDPKLRDQEIAIELKQVTAQDALEILMRASGHFYKVLDEHTIIIAADTPQNRRAYEDLMIQTFFLSNSEVRDVMTMLRSLVDSRKIAANERLNAIILRDTADKVKVAERLINTNDKARAEVVIDVELIQINTNKLRELGLSLDPGNQLVFTLDEEQVSGVGGGDGSTGGDGGAGSTVRFSDLEFLDSSSWLLTLPSFLVDFVKEHTDARILAKPQLRISEGEQASLVIGDRVPIPVTSFNTANTVGGNIVPLTSFQYQDVGITIQIEPRVHHNNEVSLVIGVEVSDITGNIGNQPIIGTRNIDTTIRLKDGETNFLAGLIRTDELTSERGIPGLADIPVIGRLFSRKSDSRQRTDIVLTLTPHIIRRADITTEDLLPIWVGTETNFSFRGGSPRVESDAEGPFDEDADAAAEAQERLRQRLEQLPRGLRDDDDVEDMQEMEEEPIEEETEEERPDAGFELAPSSGPRPSLDGLRERDRDDESRSRLDTMPELLAPPGPPEDGVIYASMAPRTTAVEGVLLSLRPSRHGVAVGDAVTVTLEVVARAAVSHLPVTLVYDPERLELLDVQEGGFLGGPEEAQILMDASTAGRVVVGASRLGSTHGVAGRGDVVELSFRALREGAARLGFEKRKALDSFLDPVGPLRSEDLVLEIGAGDGPAPGAPRPARLTPAVEQDA